MLVTHPDYEDSTVFKSVWKLMEQRYRWRLLLLVIGILLTSSLNIGGIAAIMPFIELLTTPSSEIENAIVSQVFRYLGLVQTERTIVWMGAIVLTLFVVGNGMLAFITWKSIMFSRMIAYNLSQRLFRSYIRQEYAFYLNENTSDLMKNLFGELNSIVRGVLKPLMELLVEGILVTTLVAFLVLIDPSVAIIAAVLLGGGYLVIFLGVRTILNRASKVKVRRNAERFRTAMDAFNAIKELKLLGLEERYAELYDRATYRSEQARAKIQGIAKLPRYVLETVAFGGVLGLALFLFVRGEDTASVLPLMGAYVVAGYKLLPSMQRIFAALAHIRGSHASVELIVHELERPVPSYPADERVEPIAFSERIVLDSLTFAYENTSRPALRSISLEIPKNKTIGIAGPTGCGKTTLVDTILGLHTYQSGTLSVDGLKIDAHNVRQWRKNFGYVPQTIYLSDTTVTRNIAFGIDDDQIDHDRVRFVAELANLHSFVTSLELGYNTELGERGVRLSGGQRQRIGIARALYHDPDVLVFDEATSALDTRTEQAVMEAIQTLMHKKTIIIIAHRLSTLKDADSIVVLRDGEVDAIGTYEQLSLSHPHFLRVNEKP